MEGGEFWMMTMVLGAEIGLWTGEVLDLVFVFIE